MAGESGVGAGLELLDRVGDIEMRGAAIAYVENVRVGVDRKAFARPCG